jgi:hypothetical protein
VSRPKPRYGETHVQLTEQARQQRAGQPNRRVPEEQFVAVDLKCEECGDTLYRILRPTYAEADGSLQVRVSGGGDPAVKQGLILVECGRCEREVGVPEPMIAHLLEVAAAAVGVGGHAQDTLDV